MSLSAVCQSDVRSGCAGCQVLQSAGSHHRLLLPVDHFPGRGGGDRHGVNHPPGRNGTERGL